MQKNIESSEQIDQSAESPDAIRESVLAELFELGDVDPKVLDRIRDGLKNLEGGHLQQAVASMKALINETRFANQKLDVKAKQDIAGVIGGSATDEKVNAEDEMESWLSQA